MEGQFLDTLVAVVNEYIATKTKLTDPNLRI